MQFYKRPLWSVINHAALVGGACPHSSWWWWRWWYGCAVALRWPDWWVDVINRCPHCHSCRWWWWWRWWTTETIFLRSGILSFASRAPLLAIGGTLSGALFFSLLSWKFTLLWVSEPQARKKACSLSVISCRRCGPTHLQQFCRQFRMLTFYT